jgi:hypothetical protein
MIVTGPARDHLDQRGHQAARGGRHRPQEVGRGGRSLGRSRGLRLANDLELAREMIKAADEASSAASSRRSACKELVLYASARSTSRSAGAWASTSTPDAAPQEGCSAEERARGGRGKAVRQAGGAVQGDRPPRHPPRVPRRVRLRRPPRPRGRRPRPRLRGVPSRSPRRRPRRARSPQRRANRSAAGSSRPRSLRARAGARCSRSSPARSSQPGTPRPAAPSARGDVGRRPAASSASSGRGVTLVRRSSDRPSQGVQAPALPIPVRKLESPPTVEERFSRIEKRLEALDEPSRRIFYEMFDQAWVSHDSSARGRRLHATRSSSPASARRSRSDRLEPPARRTTTSAASSEASSTCATLGLQEAPADDRGRDQEALPDPPSGARGTSRRSSTASDMPQHRLYFHEYAPPDKIAYKIRQIVDWLNEPETRKTRNSRAHRGARSLRSPARVPVPQRQRKGGAPVHEPDALRARATLRRSSTRRSASGTTRRSRESREQVLQHRAGRRREDRSRASRSSSTSTRARKRRVRY